MSGGHNAYDFLKDLFKQDWIESIVTEIFRLRMPTVNNKLNAHEIEGILVFHIIV